MGRGWRGVAVALAMLLVAAGCAGGSEAAPDEGPAPTVDVSDLDDPNATTTGVPDAEPEAAAEGEAAAPADQAIVEAACAAGVEVEVIAVAALPSDDPELSAEAALELLATLRQALPADLAEAVDRLGDLVRLLEQDPDHRDAASEELIAEVSDGVGSWADDACGDPGPRWSCTARQSFELVGEAIESSGPSRPVAEADDPEDLLDSIDQEGEPVLVDEDDTRRLYAWLDSDGRVVRTEEIERVDGRWGSGASTTCLPDGEDPFDPIDDPAGA